MIKLMGLSHRDVSVRFYNDGAHILYRIPTNEPVGSYGNYNVYTTHIYNKKSNTTSRAQNMLQYSALVLYQPDFEIKLNEAYFMLKKQAMLQVRKYQLSVIKATKVKAIEHLKNEIAFLENVKDGEPFWRTQMSDRYLSRAEKIAKTHSQLSDDDQRKFIESFF